MQGTLVLDEAFTRIPGIARRAVDGLDADALVWRPEPGANPIGWLVWHLARVQDDHVADLDDVGQLWVVERWGPRFDLPEDATETGFGHTPEQVAAVRPDGPDALLDYLDAVTERTRRLLTVVDDDDLDRVVDTSWEPHVTMGVRLVSVVGDGLQHAGQAAYLRGVHDRTTAGG